MHVLLVEDDNGVRDTICLVLKDYYTFDTAHTLDGALLRLAQRRFDCCILDLRLPDSRGERTFDAVRAAEPHLPIVVYSGSYEEGELKSILRKGASACLTKASDGLPQLREAIKNSVEWATATTRARKQLAEITKSLPLLTFPIG